jgi:transposase
MPNGYSKDLKVKAMQWLEKGQSPAQVAQRFDLSVPTVYRWKNQLETQGNLDIKARSGRPCKVKPEELEKHIKNNPDSYAREIARKMGVERSTIAKAIKRYGYTRKKKAPYTKSAAKAKENNI